MKTVLAPNASWPEYKPRLKKTLSPQGKKEEAERRHQEVLQVVRGNPGNTLNELVLLSQRQKGLLYESLYQLEKSGRVTSIDSGYRNPTNSRIVKQYFAKEAIKELMKCKQH